MKLSENACLVRHKVLVNDLVILVDENQPSLKWKLDRVNEIFISSDDFARAANVNFSTDILEYQIYICHLPRFMLK